jgi:hypothetical protein
MLRLVLPERRFQFLLRKLAGFNMCLQYMVYGAQNLFVEAGLFSISMCFLQQIGRCQSCINGAGISRICCCPLLCLPIGVVIILDTVPKRP